MKSRALSLFLPLLAFVTPSLQAAPAISQYGITWTFDKEYPTGQFCTGDYWVVGPVTVTGITTDQHAPGFTSKPGEDGSMVNPGTDSKQGYDSRIGSYDAKINAALIGGQPISATNPLVLKPGSSLVSMVSWLYRSATDAEPGTPKFNGGTKAPRPVTKAGAVLTVLEAAPPKGSFRPPYAGADKTVKFSLEKLDYSKLKNLPPVAGMPDPAELAKRMERPWIDHVYEFLGAMIHPSQNMPQYGRDMADTMGEVALMVLIDPAQLPGGKPAREKLVIELVQFGIDCAGIADSGGGWPPNGGHQLGRKYPILFAGVMLNDPHMKDVGHWKTLFHEDAQTFYVTQEDVDATHSPSWKPDTRGKDGPAPYTAEDIGMPEWSTRHATPGGNREWTVPYRAINGTANLGFVLATRIMGLEEAWNHKVLFEYEDRWMKKTGGIDGTARSPVVAVNMWKQYGPKEVPTAKP